MENSSSDTYAPTGSDSDSEANPLWLVTKHDQVNKLVRYLSNAREEILKSSDQDHVLVFSQQTLAAAREGFKEVLRQGEERLHRLCELLAAEFETTIHLQSVVIGEVQGSGERFTLSQPLSKQELYSTTDLDLGNRQLAKFRVYNGQEWQQPRLVANMVEYQPEEANALSIHKLVSRIKAEEEIWNKVCDEIFDLDSLVRRDKKLMHLSRYVKDVFGIKIVIGSQGELMRLQKRLQTLTFSDHRLRENHVPIESATQKLHFVEIKDYLNEQKKSEWMAIKSVVSWWDRLFEIQVQPLGKYLREREFLTRESHQGFKSRRESVRDQVAAQIPLFAYFRDLLRWLFDPTQAKPVKFPHLTIQLEE